MRSLAKDILKSTPFYPRHMGDYIRRMYFWREVKKLPVGRWNRVLDAGFGSGQVAVSFACRYPHLEVVGYDLKTEFPIGKLPPNLHLGHCDLRALKETNAFDFIYSIDVLEHIAGNRRVIANLYRALCPGGYLYIHIPYETPGNRIFPEHWFAAFDDWTHEEHVVEQYTLEEASALLEDIGFTIVHARWTFGFWGELDRLTDRASLLRVDLAPLLKGLARIAVSRPINDQRGDVLVVGVKAGNE